MKFRTRFKSIFFILSLISSSDSASLEKEAARTDTLDFSSGKRTFIFGKLMLIPFLATIGLKFLALLPVMLSKIALLGIMNFIASNLNLLLSVVLGLKNSFMKNRWSWFDQETPQFEISPIETAPPTTKFDFLLDSQSEKGPKVFRYIQSAGAGISDFLNFNQHEKTYHYVVDPRIAKKLQNSPIVKSPGVHNKKYVCQQLESNSKETGKYKCVWIDTYQNKMKRKIFTQPSVDLSVNKDQEFQSPVYVRDPQPELNNNQVDQEKNDNNARNFVEMND